MRPFVQRKPAGEGIIPSAPQNERRNFKGMTFPAPVRIAIKLRAQFPAPIIIIARLLGTKSSPLHSMNSSNKGFEYETYNDCPDCRVCFVEYVRACTSRGWWRWRSGWWCRRRLGGWLRRRRHVRWNGKLRWRRNRLARHVGWNYRIIRHQRNVWTKEHGRPQRGEEHEGSSSLEWQSQNRPIKESPALRRLLNASRASRREVLAVQLPPHWRGFWVRPTQ